MYYLFLKKVTDKFDEIIRRGWNVCLAAADMILPEIQRTMRIHEHLKDSFRPWADVCCLRVLQVLKVLTVLRVN